MVLNRLVGTILIGLAVWAALIIIGRIKTSKYSNLYAKLTDKEGAAGLEESYLFYYRCSMSFLSIAFLSIITLVLAYYLPLVLLSYLGIDDVSTTLMTVRSYVQSLSIMLTFFAFFSYHRCHYQLENLYKEIAK